MSARPDQLARDAAKRRLVDRHPDEFYELLAEECESLGIPTPARVELAPCGTRSAYQRHKRRGEPVDQACHDAEMTYQREWARARAAAKRVRP